MCMIDRESDHLGQQYYKKGIESQAFHDKTMNNNTVADTFFKKDAGIGRPRCPYETP